MKKFLVIVLVLGLCGGAGYYVYNKNKAQTSVQSSNLNSTANVRNSPPIQIEEPMTPIESSYNSKALANQDYVAPTSPTGGETTAPNIQVVEIDFDGTQFTPASVNINVNDYVFFKNKSKVDFWPASNPHPTHTDYPGFDALKAIPPGGEYKFQFTKAGKWGFHDHLDSSIHGVVNVSQ